MKKIIVFRILSVLVLALVLAGGATSAASAEGAVVPFKAYYPVHAEVVFNSACMCMIQTFTPGGNGYALHMGLSLFYGNATTGVMPPMTQIGTGRLVAANGDSIYVKYEGNGVVLPDGQHVISDGQFVVTGGTGRFEGFGGEGKYHVYVHLAGDVPNDLWFEGVLNKD